MRGLTKGMVAVCAIACALSRAAYAAEVCGDPDGSGKVTVSDAVQILRAAVNLGSSCSLSLCDLDANNAITLTDGINALRRAAELPATLGCGTGISNFVSDVTTSTGDHPVLEVGVAPIPGAGAPATIGTPQGSSNAVAGGSNNVTVPYDASATGAASAAGSAATGNLTFVLAVADAQGNLTDGIFETPLDTSAGQVQITVVFPQRLGSQNFILCPATRTNGVLSQYGALVQMPANGASAVQFTIDPPS